MHKRVCIDINSVLSKFARGYLSGIGRASFELVKAMQDLREDLPVDIVLYTQNARNVKASAVELYFENIHFPLPFRNNINKLLALTHSRQQLIKYDLWHCPHNTDSVDAVKNTIFTIHDLIAYNCAAEFSEKTVQKTKALLPSLLKQCKAVITCSESSKSDLIKYLKLDPQKIHVTPWGIRHDIFKVLQYKERVKKELQETFNLQRPYFLAVSCGLGRKNTPAIISAYKQLLILNPENDLVLTWNNFTADILKFLQGSNNRIRILTNVTDEELCKLYNCASAVFYPSDYEGFGFPVLEAMACGTPVVTCKNSALTETGGDAAIFSPSGTSQSILTEMIAFEKNHYNLDEIVSKGLKHAASFNWDKCARDTVNIYQQYL